MKMLERSLLVFFFNDTATTEIYTLSLHDALPISRPEVGHPPVAPVCRPGGPRPLDRHDHEALLRPVGRRGGREGVPGGPDRKSTRLNSSHANISYAVFCLKKKTRSEEHMRELHPH